MSLTAQHLHYTLGGHCLLDVPSLHLEPGQMYALLGPNGAGKSTLLHALAGLMPRLLPHIQLHGKPLSKWQPLALARQRALLSQEQHMPFDFSVDDVVRLGRYPHRQYPHPHEADLLDQCLQRTDALRFKSRPYSQLSGGEKARVQLARVLAQTFPLPQDTQARWLMLDEPTAALDLSHQHAVMNLLHQLAQQGAGVLVVVHDLNLALRYADQVLIMSKGCLMASGATASTLTPSWVSDVWGVSCQHIEQAVGMAADAAPTARGWLAF